MRIQRRGERRLREAGSVLVQSTRNLNRRARLRGPLYAAGFGVVWLALGLINPATTYHFAPLVVVPAWPVIQRFDDPAASARARIIAVAGGTAIGLVVTALLWSFDALAGPALIGGTAIAETVIGIGAGTLIGVAAATLPRRDARPQSS